MLLAAETFEGIIAHLAADAAAATPSAAAAAAASSAAAASAAGGGQRKAARVPVGGRLTVVPFAPGAEGLAGYDFPEGPDGSPTIPLSDPLSVPVRDVSRGGVRFMLGRRLPLDTPFVLLLPRPTTPTDSGHLAIATALAGKAVRLPPLAVECAVTYWQPVRRDVFAVGARFLRELPGFVASPKAPTVALPGHEEPAAAAPKAAG